MDIYEKDANGKYRCVDEQTKEDTQIHVELYNNGTVVFYEYGDHDPCPTLAVKANRLIKSHAEICNLFSEFLDKITE